MSKLSDLLDSLDLQKKYPGYFNKNVFRVSFLVFTFLLVFAIAASGFKTNYAYVTCNSQTPCENQYYQCDMKGTCPKFIAGNFCDEIDCNKQFLMPGETLGSVPPFFIRNGVMILFGVVALAFGVNHLVWRYKSGRWVYP